VHGPLQPAKVEPFAGVAVNVTTWPLLNDEKQVVPQLIPSGLLVTVPDPVPPSPTSKVKVLAAALLMAASIPVFMLPAVTDTASADPTVLFPL
jgi:hypothetical protein